MSATPSGRVDTRHGPVVMVRFLDGPLVGKGNVANMGGGHDFALPERVYGWPLPARLRVLSHHGVENVALWDADDPDGSGLPEEITNSPNAATYRKVSESQLTDEQIATMTRVVRGAAYCLAHSSSPAADQPVNIG
jgi:hypothetical protein